ncbi:VWA domain-containing protein [Bacillus tianshenii]|nr:VWA domain-containing protein [Bacillus tianshenii]
MVKNIKSIVLFLMCLLGLLGAAGCSSSQTTDNESEQLEETLSTEQLIATEPGPFSGSLFYRTSEQNQAEVIQALDNFPVLSGQGNELFDEYWSHLSSLFVEDYYSPELVISRWKVASFGNPDIEDSRFAFKQNLNVEIILDASGSMAGKIGEQTKMELAKQAIKEFAQSLPNEARVALRVYGHKGSNKKSDKEESCSRSDIIYPMQTYNEIQLNQALEEVSPTGWSAIDKSLVLAQKDLENYESDKHTNLIYLVSDGIETCGGNPVHTAKKLKSSPIKPLLNVIGFDVNIEGQKELKAIAEASEGLYVNVRNQTQLKNELIQAKEIAKKWKEWKQNASVELQAVQVDRMKWINHYEKDWYEKSWRESLNIDASIEYLYASGKLSEQAKTYFNKRKEQREQVVTESKQELIQYLIGLTESSFRKLEKEVQQKHESNIY